MSTYDDLGVAPHAAITQDDAHTVFGQVMGLVALTVGCAALGAYLGRNLSGGLGLAFFIGVLRASSGSTSRRKPDAISSRSDSYSQWGS
jgi:modulator of FtsH protease